jgi:hypothetical protein
MYDALLALRSLTDRATAVTATGAGGGFVNLHHIPAGNGTYVGTPGLPGALGDVAGLFGQTPFDVVVFVDTIDTTSGTETYTLKLQSVDSAKANPVDVPGGSVVHHLRSGRRALRPEGLPVDDQAGGPERGVPPDRPRPGRRHAVHEVPRVRGSGNRRGLTAASSFGLKFEGRAFGSAPFLLTLNLGESHGSRHRQHWQDDHKAVTGADDSVTLGANWVAASIIADVDCHFTVDGSAADQTAFYPEGRRAVRRSTCSRRRPPTRPLTGGGGTSTSSSTPPRPPATSGSPRSAEMQKAVAGLTPRRLSRRSRLKTRRQTGRFLAVQPVAEHVSTPLRGGRARHYEAGSR